MNYPPEISVIMPVYNGEKYLREAIDSILNQTFSDFEFIILNDGSTDKTEEIILSYSDPRIVYVKNEENLQIVKTLNKGIALAKGKYIARMDADDVSVPERLFMQHHYLTCNPNVDLCSTFVETFGGFKNKWSYPTCHEDIKVAMLFFSPIAHAAIMCKSSLLKNCFYNDEYNKAEDYYLWSELIKNYTFSVIPQYLYLYRQHEDMTCVKANPLQLSRANQVRKKLLADFGLNYAEDEFDLHVSIGRYKRVDFIDAEEWFIKILAHNDKVKFYEEYALKKFIAKHWLRIVNQNSERGVRVLFYYFLKSRLPAIKKPFPIFKFFIKCMIKKKARI